MRVSFRRVETGTLVEAETSIRGQSFDFGKSRRLLDAFFGELAATS